MENGCKQKHEKVFDEQIQSHFSILHQHKEITLSKTYFHTGVAGTPGNHLPFFHLNG